MTDRLTITLARMRFHALVGVLPHEREHRQPLEVDLSVLLAPATPGAGGVDYRELHALVRAAVEGGERDWIEAIAARIADAALALPPVRGCRVAVRKPHVALGAPLDHAEVVLERGAD